MTLARSPLTQPKVLGNICQMCLAPLPAGNGKHSGGARNLRSLFASQLRRTRTEGRTRGPAANPTLLERKRGSGWLEHLTRRSRLWSDSSQDSKLWKISEFFSVQSCSFLCSRTFSRAQRPKRDPRFLQRGETSATSAERSRGRRC